MKAFVCTQLTPWHPPLAVAAVHTGAVACATYGDALPVLICPWCGSTWTEDPAPPLHPPQPVRVMYENWRGAVRQRLILPIRLRFGTHEPWHPGPQWLLEAHDMDINKSRTFALAGIREWLPPGRVGA